MLSYELPLPTNRRVLRVMGIPRPKPRQTNRDRWKPSKSVEQYRYWADLVRLSWAESFPGEPWIGPISLSCVFEFPIPDSWSKGKKNEALNGMIQHASPPDLDNLVKGVADALNHQAWVDDCQIVGYFEPIMKVWAPPEQAGVWIAVEKMT